MSQKMTMTKRYYSTSSAVNYPPLLTTLGEAVENAKTKLTEDDKKNEIYIVEVIKIIRKVSAPFEVIDVRR